MFKKWVVGLGVLFLMLYAWPNYLASANLSNCEAGINPNQISPGSTSDIQFAVQNTDVTSIQWVQVDVPSSNFSIANVSADGWTNSYTNSQANLTGGNLGPGSTLYFTVTTTASDTQESGN